MSAIQETEQYNLYRNFLFIFLETSLVFLKFKFSAPQRYEKFLPTTSQ